MPYSCFAKVFLRVLSSCSNIMNTCVLIVLCSTVLIYKLGCISISFYYYCSLLIYCSFHWLHTCTQALTGCKSSSHLSAHVDMAIRSGTCSCTDRKTVKTLSSLSNNVRCVYKPPEITNADCETLVFTHACNSLTSILCHVFFSCPLLYHPSSSCHRALPCLVWSLAEDSEAPGGSTKLCWKLVHNDGQQQIQLHLSLAVKPADWTRGREGTGVEKRVHVNVCVCVSGLEVTVEGHWLGCQSCMECMCVKEREGGRAQSAAAAERVNRCYCMSLRPTNLQQRNNTSLDSFPLPALICLGSFYGAFGLRKQSMVLRWKCQWSPS